MAHSDTDVSTPTGQLATEHIIVIGSNKLSALYIDFLRAYAPDRYRVIAVLDDGDEMIGRSIAGVRVLAPSNHLLPVIEEFKEHGVTVNRIIVGGNEDFLTQETMVELDRVCDEYNVRLDFIPELIGLKALQESTVESQAKPKLAPAKPISLPRYFLAKRFVDFCLSFLLIVILLPIFLLVAIVVLLDVGSPVFYWQRRIGMNAQVFQMHKFRTLKPAFDWRGRPIGMTERISWVGALVRKLRLDELPQLLNVLVGDMSLVGPRPLLPHDQPPDPTLRLMARPGITGWAQVNGGKLLTVEEKNARDEWYIRNASLWLDLKILVKTVPFILAGERSEMETTAAADRPESQTSAVHGS